MLTVGACRMTATAFFNAMMDSPWSDLSTTLTPRHPASSIFRVSHFTADSVGAFVLVAMAHTALDR